MVLRRTLSMIVAALVTIGLSATLLAVKYGVPDEGEHPYVGLVVFYDSNNTPQWTFSPWTTRRCFCTSRT